MKFTGEHFKKIQPETITCSMMSWPNHMVVLGQLVYMGAEVHPKYSDQIIYRQYKIDRDFGHWGYVHKDFDGAPEYSNGPVLDARCGSERYLDDVLDAIDELEDSSSQMSGLNPGRSS